MFPKILDITFISILVLISFTIGRRIFYLFKIQFKSFLEEFAFSVGIGLGFVGYLILFLGLVGLLYNWSCLLLLIILLCFALWELIKSKPDIIEVYHKLQVFLKNCNQFERILLVIIFFTIILIFTACLAPPMDLDSLVYHLSIPKLWIQNHKIVYIPYILSSEFPLTIETLYTLGMILTDDVSTGLIIWMYSVLFILSIFSFCKEHFSVKVGILASSAYCCIPLFGSLSVRTLIDIATAYYAFLGLYAFLRYLESDDFKWLVLCSAVSGISASTKHSGMIPFVVLAISIAIVELKRRRLSVQSFKRIIICYVVFFAIPLPWYIKSFINTGNPTVIYFTNIFGGRNLLPDDMSNTIITWRSSYGYRPELMKFLVSPIKLLLKSFFIGPRYWLLGPFASVFVPLLIITKNISKVIKYLLAYSFGLLILYSIVTDQTRLAIPAFTGLFIVGSYSTYQILDKFYKIKRLVQFVIIISFIINMIPLLQDVSEKIPNAIGLETRDQYLERRVDVYSAIDYANRNLEDNVKILGLDPRGYHFNKPYVIGATIFQGYIRFDEINDLPQLLGMLKSYGITHILAKDSVAKSVIPFWDKLKPRMTLLYSNKGNQLYKLNI